MIIVIIVTIVTIDITFIAYLNIAKKFLFVLPNFDKHNFIIITIIDIIASYD